MTSKIIRNSYMEELEMINYQLSVHKSDFLLKNEERELLKLQPILRKTDVSKMTP